MTDRQFRRGILLIAAAALVGRIVLTLVAAKPIGGDPAYFTAQGRLIAHGHWFVDPYYLKALHVYDPSAAHPPLFSLFFAGVSRIGFESATSYRVAAACLGGVAVGVIGYAGRRVAGARAGIVAGLIAAIYPYLWSTDLLVLSETLVALVAAVVLIAAYRYVARPSVVAAALVGVAVAAAALTRAESVLLFPLLALPLAWRGGGTDRAKRLVVVTVATVIPLLPWVVFNVVRFDHTEFLSTGAGGALADSSCDVVFYGPRIGWWENRCIPDEPGDESSRDRALRTLAFDYWRNHEHQLPLVMAARVGRVWEVFRPVQTAQFDWLEGRGKASGMSGLLVYLATVPLAVAGAFVLRARGRPLLPFLAVVVTVGLTAVVFYGGVRFRAPADVALIVLAAAAIDATVTAASTHNIGSADARKRGLP
ncbi:MAG: hypothetical protein JWL83_4285 [Actinomycetia bacterium]|nr:hypothetical protein [Actinomycetes bacterium]